MPAQIGVDPVIGQRTQHDDEREDADQQRSSEQDDRVGEVQRGEPPEEDLGRLPFQRPQAASARVRTWRRSDRSLSGRADDRSSAPSGGVIWQVSSRELDAAYDAITDLEASVAWFLQTNVDWHQAVAAASHSEILAVPMTALSRSIYTATENEEFVDAQVRQTAARAPGHHRRCPHPSTGRRPCGG
jgi:hypothetical protein